MFRELFNVKGDPNVLVARYNQSSTLLFSRKPEFYFTINNHSTRSATFCRYDTLGARGFFLVGGDIGFLLFWYCAPLK